MKPTPALPAPQQLRARLDSNGVLDLVTDMCFADTLRRHLPAHRQRLYPPIETLAMFVSQTLSDDRSCQRVVDERIARSLARDTPTPSSSTGAYCAARQRLPLPLVSALCRQVAHRARDIARAEGALPERDTLLIDGTGLSMPDTPENQSRFPQPASQEPGCGFPQGRMVGLVCATTGVLVDAALSAAKGKGSDESTALRTLSAGVAPGTVLIGDAIYENYWTWATLRAAGCDGIFEINGSRFLGRRTRGKRRVTIDRPTRPAWMSREQYETIPKSIVLRLVISRKKGCLDKRLLTSLLEHGRFPNAHVCQQYGRRWDVESDFCSIKDVLGAGVLACRTPEMIVKELWTYLLGYNLIRLLACEAALASGCEPRSISFRHTAQLWGAWAMLGEELDERRWMLLLDRIAQRRVRNRPGRREPRAIKRRPKPRSLLDLPRPLARCCCSAYERR